MSFVVPTVKVTTQQIYFLDFPQKKNYSFLGAEEYDHSVFFLSSIPLISLSLSLLTPVLHLCLSATLALTLYAGLSKCLPHSLSFSFSLRGAVYLAAIENNYQTPRIETWFRHSLSCTTAFSECRAPLPQWPTKWNYVFIHWGGNTARWNQGSKEWYEL